MIRIALLIALLATPALAQNSAAPDEEEIVAAFKICAQHRYNGNMMGRTSRYEGEWSGCDKIEAAYQKTIAAQRTRETEAKAKADLEAVKALSDKLAK